ncbi:hypothetical protein SLUN_38340 (plasmid) [Streptomyces lunaelactis]|uniref:DUF1579 domain-containing protein n=1 Tax=Streptomyces lunaelactis TaxID=1535768 RepID=A0A2R4TFI3_9ACTN|nr:DUF1579 family protein [Streptomyces lunaelactis]AVZ77898.1 hypothetical protein SLUN_38340 [Streptomyces lunaelactis]NUK83442.1 DUF1579 family protein [Streptomyces lunaelactis]
MAILSDSVGTWAGTNGFRLMPDSPFAEFSATATVTLAAGGHLTSVAYSWEHPDDGPQDGLLVLGSAGDDGSLVAMWGDSWHQQPAPMSLSGSRGADATVKLDGSYDGGWGWRVVLEAAGEDSLRMRMDNVIPENQATAEITAGPYPVMVMDLRRA